MYIDSRSTHAMISFFVAALMPFREEWFTIVFNLLPNLDSNIIGKEWSVYVSRPTDKTHHSHGHCHRIEEYSLRLFRFLSTTGIPNVKHRREWALDGSSLQNLFCRHCVCRCRWWCELPLWQLDHDFDCSLREHCGCGAERDADPVQILLIV